MLFEFSKLFWDVVQLGNLLVLLLVLATAGLLLGFRRAPIFLALVTLAFIAVAVLPLGRWAITPLENRFPQPTLPARIDGIILLGGAIHVDATAAHGQVATNEYAERISETLELARRFPDAKVLITGGDVSAVPGSPDEAEAMRRMLVAEGLDEHRMMLEERSRNTFENAIYSVALARPRPDQTWLLVTSAFHMPRAVGCFRHVGWNVLPFPVDYQTAPSPIIGWDFESDLRVLDLAWHEWLGLTAYRILGRIDQFFPGPAPAPISSQSAS
ncbi:MAG TPA: YdcF family protein [Stellaceae bacterium]|nr:YdcF family protein [Stellaceae bacterium]